ncbi:GiOR-2 [Hexamita inflata]|uniref:GiOR-2 n=1 Tax=Hexamita inflata TaxID=28002 RepID=A0AA86QM39_9EUKA|nr:GiOR-2 [Hexamita inflata]
MTQSVKAYPFLGSNQEEFIQSLKNSVVPVPIIFATQTQTCKQLANQLARYFQSGQIKAKIIDVAALTPEDLAGPFFVYLTCTFFMGDHPKSALQFVGKLRENDPVWAEAIKSKYFSVFGIGSLKYKLFCKASDELDAKFTELGANRVMRVSRVDRNVPQGYEPQFQEWMKDLLDNMGIDKVEESQSLYETKVQSKYPFIAPPKNYFWCKLLERKQLSDNVVDGIQHYYKFELPATNPYKAGQHIAIMPRNHRQVMNQVFQNKIIYLDDECKQLAEPEQLVKMNVLAQEGSNLPLSNDFYSVWDLIAQYTDLHSMVNQNVLALLAQFARDENQQKELKMLGDTAHSDLFQKKFVQTPSKIGDLFQSYNSLKIPLHRFLEIVPPMRHRLYSIASSPKLIGNQFLELIVTDVQWDGINVKTGETVQQRGLCTGFLYELSGQLQWWALEMLF